MRKFTVAMCLLFGLSFAAFAHAQTWESPLDLSGNPYYPFQNSCIEAPQKLTLDVGEYQVFAPVMVYRVRNLQIPRPYKTFRPRMVNLVPTLGTDLSIWVCRTHSGDWLTDCVDESDNGPGAPNTVIVPPEAGIFYIAVTAGITQFNPECGSYALSSSYY